MAFRGMGGLHCPICWSPKTVIYRRSGTSVTFRCNNCTLQWTMTFLKIHQAAKAMAAKLGSDNNEGFYFEMIADRTADAAERGAARRSSIKQLLQTGARRVIRLPDRAT
jgi:hypothetical protein